MQWKLIRTINIRRVYTNDKNKMYFVANFLFNHRCNFLITFNPVT